MTPNTPGGLPGDGTYRARDTNRGANPGSAQRLSRAERRQKAVELRKAGAAYRDIAKALNINASSAHRDVMAVLDELNKQMLEDGAQVRRLELERLDQIQMYIWRVMQSAAGNPNRHIEADPGVLFGAVDRLLKLSERRAKLEGIDAPTRTELTGKDGKPLSLEMVDQMLMEAGLTNDDGLSESDTNSTGSAEVRQ